MAREILEYAQGKVQLEHETIGVDAFLDQAAEALQPIFTLKRLHLEIVNQASGTISVDTARMIRALVNIAGNASDVLPPGDTLVVRARRDEGAFVLELEDNGPGIPDAIADKLFDPFVSHGKAGGVGLGMALVKSIVEAHGGTIYFETEVDTGTTFFVRLP